MWPPPGMRRKRIRILIPAASAALLGGAGWLLGPLWALAGILSGPVAATSVLLVIIARGKPDPGRLLQAGRRQEAYHWLEQDLSFARKLAARRPMFRDVLADKLGTMSQLLEALGDEPRALEVATEAATIYTDLSVKQPGRYTAPLAHMRLREADLLSHLGRHGEALGAAEPAVRLYRHLTIHDRSTYLPRLAAALTRQADELGYLDRLTEARAAAAEAKMITTDMLPSSSTRS